MRAVKKPRAAAALLWSCALAASAARAQVIRPRADMGREGNVFVARSFDAYRRLHPDGACRAQGSGERVILTGYGLFAGVPYNVSGTVVRSMADPAFWPERADLDARVPLGAAAPTSAEVAPSAKGGVAFNRTLFIDGKRYEVCLLVLDVIWDLAGAIVIHEESRFKPALVLMTGRGSGQASFEAGALNTASPAPGYDEEGRSLGTVNLPESPWLLPSYPVGFELPMTWDAAALSRASEPAVASLGYASVGQSAARPENSYLCNDISFVALNSAKNKPTSLAGGEVLLASPELPREPVVGFLHFPAVDERHPDLASYGRGIFAWGQVLAETVGRAAAPR